MESYTCVIEGYRKLEFKKSNIIWESELEKKYTSKYRFAFLSPNSFQPQPIKHCIIGNILFWYINDEFK